jgi:hypothetical protein
MRKLREKVKLHGKCGVCGHRKPVQKVLTVCKVCNDAAKVRAAAAYEASKT